jgi:probable O-glycosylation ligase (exosortase A-associated)
MILPLLFYLRTLVAASRVRSLLLVGIFLCFAAILGTQSRGAFVGIAAMGMLLALRSPNRGAYLLLLMGALPFAFLFMPDQWSERMASILDYENDPSALGRINAWWMAFYLAIDNPIFGAGLQGFTRYAFMLYAPEPERVHDAHSIYFEVLGEQGFVGLAIFLALGIATLLKAEEIRKVTVRIPELKWLRDLANMVQLSILGFAVCGLFLGLAYFNFYYMLIAVVVGADSVLQRVRVEQPDLFAVRTKGWHVADRGGSWKPGGLRPGPVPGALAGRQVARSFQMRDLPRLGRELYRRL